jgi:hypothetical protein
VIVFRFQVIRDAVGGLETGSPDLREEKAQLLLAQLSHLQVDVQTAMRLLSGVSSRRCCLV